MKKILFVVVAMVSLSFMACNNGATTVGSSADSTAVDSVEVVDSIVEVADSVAADSVNA